LQCGGAGFESLIVHMLHFIAGFNTAAIVFGVPLLYMLSDTTKSKRAARQFERAHSDYTCDDPFSSSGRTPGSEPGNRGSNPCEGI
jgi:hypothetical protein